MASTSNKIRLVCCSPRTNWLHMSGYRVLLQNLIIGLLRCLLGKYQGLKRIDILGVSEPEITIEGENHIRVKLAGITNIDDARNTIASTATLSFRDYNDNLLMTSDVLGGQAKVTKDQYGKPAVSLKIKDVDTAMKVVWRLLLRLLRKMGLMLFLLRF